MACSDRTLALTSGDYGVVLAVASSDLTVGRGLARAASHWLELLSDLSVGRSGSSSSISSLRPTQIATFKGDSLIL